MKVHCPVAETLPANAAFPTTLTVLKDALVKFATFMFAAEMDALLMVANPITAL